MGNTYLRIKDPIIRTALREIVDMIKSDRSFGDKVKGVIGVASEALKVAKSAKTIAEGKNTIYRQPTQPIEAVKGDIWVDTSDNNKMYQYDGTNWVVVSYTFTDLQTDLKKGVSVVFKDISEFDANYPSAIAIGNITLNQDGTVAYGSRGVAVTKNGLAGFDDSYNGAGDLPSFSIDTNGNVYLRGEIHAQSGSFAGELKSAYGTFGTITAGKLQNQEGSNYVDLNATGAADFIRINHLDHLRSDGRFRFGNGKIEWDGRTFKLVSNDDTLNELTNWNFDDGVNGWTIDTTITGSVIFYDQAPNGSPDIHVYKFKNTDTANEAAIYQEVSASQGEEFTAIAYVASDAAVDYGVHLYIDFLDSNGASLGDGGATTTLASAQSFRKLVIRGAAPANAATARLKVALAANANSTDAYWYVTYVQLKRTRFGDDRVEISGSDIKFYKTLESSPYKFLRKIEAGVAKNGDTVTLTGFYDRVPYILISPSSLDVYNASGDGQNQKIDTFVSDLNGSSTIGEWTFKVNAVLRISDTTTIIENSFTQSCNNSQDTGYQQVDAYTISNTESNIPSTFDSVRLELSGGAIGAITQCANNGTATLDPKESDVTMYYRVHYYYGGQWNVTDFKSVTSFITSGSFNINDYLSIPSGTSSIKIEIKLHISQRNYNSVNVSTSCSNCHGGGILNDFGVQWDVTTTSGRLIFTKSGSDVLAEGSLNWIAIG